MISLEFSGNMTLQLAFVHTTFQLYLLYVLDNGSACGQGDIHQKKNWRKSSPTSNLHFWKCRRFTTCLEILWQYLKPWVGIRAHVGARAPARRYRASPPARRQLTSFSKWCLQLWTLLFFCFWNTVRHILSRWPILCDNDPGGRRTKGRVERIKVEKPEPRWIQCSRGLVLLKRCMNCIDASCLCASERFSAGFQRVHTYIHVTYIYICIGFLSCQGCLKDCKISKARHFWTSLKPLSLPCSYVLTHSRFWWC